MTQQGAMRFNKLFQSIRARLLIAFAFLVVLPAGAITANSIAVGLENGRQQAYEQFESVAALKESWLRIWIQSLQTDLLGLARERWHRQAASMLAEQPAPDPFQGDHQYLVDRLVQVMELTNRYDELFLLSRDGVVMVSTDPVKTGEFRGLQPYFQQGLKQAGVHVQSMAFSSASEKLNNIMVVRPVVDAGGEAVGVLCGQANFGMVNSIMGQRTGLGESGETYLVGSNHLLMTIARFPGYTPGMASIYARGVNTAIANRSNTFGRFEDYRGVPVIGVYHWMPELDVVLAAEQDGTEAFGPIYTALKRNAILAVLAVLVACGVALLFTRSISRPVASLSATATRIAEGDLQLTAEIERADEIGSLAQSFNQMTARLRERIDTERLLANMSRKFISLPVAESEQAIEQAIGEIGMALGVDRSYVFRFSLDEQTVSRGQGWCRQDVPPRHKNLDAMVLEDLPWFGEKIRNHEIVDVVSLADLPPAAAAEKAQWERDGIQSLICVPMVYGDSLRGFVGLDAVREKRSWLSEDISLLQMAGEIILNAVAKERTEAKMCSLRNLLKNIIDSMPSVLIGVDISGKVTQWNREAQNVTGLSAEKAHGCQLDTVFPHLVNEMEKVRKAIEDRKPKKDQKVTINADGTGIFSEITVYPLVSNGVDGAVIRVDDVTERVRIQEMMIQSEKMLSVGGLAAGMAHEINNPLAAIMQSAQVIVQRTKTNLPVNLRAAEECGVSMSAIEKYMDIRDIYTLLDSIQQSGERASQIVDNMLSFSRKGEYSFERHVLSEIVDETVELASSDYDLKKKYDFRLIQIERDYLADLPMVPCEKTKIQQVIFNLLKNAAEAMAEQDKRSDDPKITLRLLQKDNMARIEVEDNGPGMEESIRKRVLEPFYTTKSVGQGTGLGLSVSYFIVKENHGGNMIVESTPGKGTRFIIHLPFTRT